MQIDDRTAMNFCFSFWEIEEGTVFIRAGDTSDDPTYYLKVCEISSDDGTIFNCINLDNYMHSMFSAEDSIQTVEATLVLEDFTRSRVIEE